MNADKEKSLAIGSEMTQETWANFVERLRHDCVGKGVEDHYTADAIFIVQAKKYVFGIDPDYGADLVIIQEDSHWFSPDKYWEDASDDEQITINAQADDMFGDEFLNLDERAKFAVIGELDDVTVTGYEERWEYVCAHFTKDAAESFIRRKKHDYRDGLRIYVEAQVYCWEYNAIKEAILSGRIGLVP